jgi:hypothetical protein
MHDDIVKFGIILEKKRICFPLTEKFPLSYNEMKR